MRYCLKKKKTGFTLTELLVVVVIIAILASLGIVRYPGIVKMGKESEAKAMLKVIRAAQKRYFLENNRYVNDNDLSNGSPLDIDISPSQYYTYRAVDGTGNILARASARVAGISDFRIDIDGNIN